MADVSIFNLNGTNYNIKDTIARSAATQAKSTADRASTTATAAQEAAETAKNTADAAKTTANNTANAAKTAATTANNTANAAKTAADKALADAWNITYSTDTETLTFDKVEE